MMSSSSANVWRESTASTLYAGKDQEQETGVAESKDDGYFEEKKKGKERFYIPPPEPNPAPVPFFYYPDPPEPQHSQTWTLPSMPRINLPASTKHWIAHFLAGGIIILFFAADISRPDTVFANLGRRPAPPVQSGMPAININPQIMVNGPGSTACAGATITETITITQSKYCVTSIPTSFTTSKLPAIEKPQSPLQPALRPTSAGSSSTSTAVSSSVASPRSSSFAPAETANRRPVLPFPMITSVMSLMPSLGDSKDLSSTSSRLTAAAPVSSKAALSPLPSPLRLKPELTTPVKGPES